MIQLQQGDMLEADVEALVNAVNTKGVMGKGIALQFKKAYPAMFKAYHKACRVGEVQTGKMHTFDRGVSECPRYIINFPTKAHWRLPSKIEYIQDGLSALVLEVKHNAIQSIAIPALGCGLGGLEWDEVFPMIQTAFLEFPEVRVLVYPPAEIWK
jgi:O-acetyl-ADP-ribose deacetylase (regulator of RNase III)